MLKLTKFLGLHNGFFSQKIPIRNNTLTWIHFTFRVDTLFTPGVISFRIDEVGSLNCIPLEIVFIIVFISSSMCPSMKIQKDAIDKGTGRFRRCIPWQLRYSRCCCWIK